MISKVEALSSNEDFNNQNKSSVGEILREMAIRHNYYTQNPDFEIIDEMQDIVSDFKMIQNDLTQDMIVSAFSYDKELTLFTQISSQLAELWEEYEQKVAALTNAGEFEIDSLPYIFVEYIIELMYDIDDFTILDVVEDLRWYAAEINEDYAHCNFIANVVDLLAF